MTRDDAVYEYVVDEINYIKIFIHSFLFPSSKIFVCNGFIVQYIWVVTSFI
jgi:hypothetical protein